MQAGGLTENGAKLRRYGSAIKACVAGVRTGLTYRFRRPFFGSFFGRTKKERKNMKECLLYRIFLRVRNLMHYRVIAGAIKIATESHPDGNRETDLFYHGSILLPHIFKNIESYGNLMIIKHIHCNIRCEIKIISDL